MYKNKITKKSIFEHLLLKVRINYTQYFAKNPISIIRSKNKFIHNIEITYKILWEVWKFDIEEKYGQLEIKLTRIIQKQHTNITKIKYDTNYLLYCKRNSLITHFARLTFAVKTNKYLRDEIGRQILGAKIRNKHRKKKMLLQQFKNNTDSIKNQERRNKIE